MGTLQSWRKAYGALKDTTKVGIANLSSDFKDVDIAIVKATNHVECPPKERHLRKILAATSVIRPRADVAYCIHALARRLAKTHNWTVALKTLIVIHRTLREGDPTFREELLSFSQRGRILQLSNFKDDSSPIAWDCSAWVRTYALFLEERLECFRILKYDVEAERLTKPTEGHEKGHSRTRDLDSEELLEQLPALQQLLYRLIGCRPEGAAVGNYVIQYALALENITVEPDKVSTVEIIIPAVSYADWWAAYGVDPNRKGPALKKLAMKILGLTCSASGCERNWSTFEAVLKESFKIYCAINDGIINLVDKFFEMPRHEAFKALEIYKRAGQQAGSLSDFYEICRGLELARNFQFPVLREPPQSFLATMEEYIREAPRMVSVSREPLEFQERLLLTYKPEELPSPSEDRKPSVEEQIPAPANIEVAPPPPNPDTGDLLGLNAVHPDASAIEESNALALAIVPSGATASHDSNNMQANVLDPTGWELALVTTPSTNTSVERQLAGGMDSLTLDSLYDEAAYRQSQPAYGVAPPNPFEMQDPFAASNSVAAPPSVQLAAMAQQQQMSMMMPSNPFFQPNNHPQQQQHSMTMGPSNPFGDAGFGSFALNHPPHLQNNPFGNTGLL